MRLNCGHVGGALIERVEHDALRRILCRDFEDVTVAHPAECDALGEEQRSRVGGADPRRLQTRRREHEHL